MSEEQLRRQLYESFANRAHLYHLILEELRVELGPQRAEEVLGRAIARRGAQKAAGYARFAPGDLEGLKDAFVGGLPDGGALFAPEVVRCDAGGLDVKFHRCPLKQAWLDAGLPEDEVARLCRIAAEVDRGMFEAAGYRFDADTYQPGGEGCCFLHVRPGPDRA
jgi:L-2-amino-thiazoline-4-carboxylic acid hydrolase